jgi:hypothetical protein
VQHQGRQRDLLQSGSERFHQIVGELPHEPDRVRDRGLASAREGDAAGGGVQGREQLIGHENVRGGQRVHQRRLPSVRVTDDGDLRRPGGLPAGPLELARPGEALHLPVELGDASADVLAVHLQLGLARPPGPDAAAQSRHGLTPPPQPGQEVVQLGQLHLGLALSRAGVQREDVEDQRGAVDDLCAEPFLQVPELPGGQLVVEDHRLRSRGVHRVVELGQLPPPEERGRVRPGPALDHPRHGLGSGGFGERRELLQILLAGAGGRAHQHGSLAYRRPPRGGERRLGNASPGGHVVKAVREASAWGRRGVGVRGPKHPTPHRTPKTRGRRKRIPGSAPFPGVRSGVSRVALCTPAPGTETSGGAAG